MARFILPPNALDDLGNATRRLKWNIQALQLLKDLEEQQRPPTLDEQQVIAHFSAFGESAVLNRVIDDERNADGTYKASELVGDLMDHTEIQEAVRAALTAFYTPPSVATAIWTILEHLGIGKLATLRVLEPALGGAGMFIGTMPAAIREKAEIIAVELDPTAVRVARQLYPEITLLGPQGFEVTHIPDGYFDLAISNVPFLDVRVVDETGRYRESNERPMTRTLHDYFIARMMDAVRPGGIVALLTSYGTMDKNSDFVRQWLADRGRLLVGMRLPNGVFLENGGSMAGCDLLIFRKYQDGDEKERDPEWTRNKVWELPLAQGDRTYGVSLSQKCDKGYRASNLNRIFGPNSHYVIGGYECFYKRAQHDYAYFWAVVPPPQTTTTLADIIAQSVVSRGLELEGGIITAADGAVALERKQFDREDHAVMVGNVPERSRERVAQALEVFRTAKALLKADRGVSNDDPTQLRLQLNAQYDAFVLSHGTFHDKRNRQTVGKWLVEYVFLLGLEHNQRSDISTKRVFVDKAPIFERNIQRAYPQVIAGQATPHEALAICLNIYGNVRLDYIAELAGTSREDIVAALGGIIFRVPDLRQDAWVTADDYLSGNVRKKLREVKAALVISDQFQVNVDALAAALPETIPANDITVNLGASWVPPELVSAFLGWLLPEFRHASSVAYLKAIAKWEINSSTYVANSFVATNTWGTGRRNAIAIVQDCLDQQISLVHDTDADGRRTVNGNDTLAAQEKQVAIKEAWEKWIWSEPARTAQMVEIYNELMNGMVVREYNGGHLTLPGLNGNALRVGDLDPHQKNATWQGLTNASQTMLLAHPPGAGKTFVMVAIAYEARRLGLARKPVLVGLKDQIEELAKEALRIYPEMRVLAIQSEDFEKGRRQAFLATAATGDWDLVIIGQSTFKRIAVSPELNAVFLNTQIAKLRVYLDQMERLDNEDGNVQARRRSKKQIEKVIRKYEVKIKERSRNVGRDDARILDWEEIGFDLLMVDEAHNYKNLEFQTRMGNIAGVPRGGSQQAFDMWMKTWDLLVRRKDGRVVFATATPVANTLAEVFVLMTYLQPTLLEDLGLEYFDAWAATFAVAVPAFELKPDASGFRFATRLAAFVNLPELAALTRQVMNVRTKEQLQLPEPKMVTGRMIPTVTEATEFQRAFIRHLGARADRIKARMVEPTEDNMLKVTSEGRLAALDQRLVGGPYEEGCKIDRLVDEIYGHYVESDAFRGTQLVFSDLATPKAKDKDRNVA